MRENPLSDFVVLPTHLKDKLWYSNVLTGIIKGALEMINLKVKASFVKDTLRGDSEVEIRIELQEVLTDKYEDDED